MSARANPGATGLAPTRMRPLLALASLALAGAAFAGCARRSAVEDERAATAVAQSAVGDYKRALKGELTSALASGPDRAIDVCATRAPALASEHGKPGVRVGRSAQKLRTKADAPSPWLVPVMDRLSRAKSGSTEPVTVRLPDGRWGYAEPIWIQAPCLTCHGDSLAPGVDAKLRALYPDDAARGFHEGDFRGVFFAEVAPEALAGGR